jgi:hypothetical protein
MSQLKYTSIFQYLYIAEIKITNLLIYYRVLLFPDKYGPRITCSVVCRVFITDCKNLKYKVFGLCNGIVFVANFFGVFHAVIHDQM